MANTYNIGDKVTLKLNQLPSDNERYVVIELDVPSGASAGDQEVAEVGISYLDIESGARSDAKTSVRARFSDDAKEAEASINKTVMSQVTEQVATENSERAVELRDNGDIDGARKVLRLIDALEDSDDVQNVWANFDASDEVLEAAEA